MYDAPKRQLPAPSGGSATTEAIRQAKSFRFHYPS